MTNIPRGCPLDTVAPGSRRDTPGRGSLLWLLDNPPTYVIYLRIMFEIGLCFAGVCVTAIAEDPRLKIVGGAIAVATGTKLILDGVAERRRQLMEGDDALDAEFSWELD